MKGEERGRESLAWTAGLFHSAPLHLAGLQPQGADARRPGQVCPSPPSLAHCLSLVSAVFVSVHRFRIGLHTYTKNGCRDLRFVIVPRALPCSQTDGFRWQPDA